ncbi:MAG: DUF389 domain-containing protein [Solirubrobacterales bacterium]
MTSEGSFRSRLEGVYRTPDEIRDAAYLLDGDVLAKQSRYWLLLTLSAVIATAGIISDSTATVIGAMIIAPLATPIQGIAVAITYGEVRPLLQSAAILIGSTALVIAIGATMALILPELKEVGDNSQISGRISPTLIDLVAAAATGLAGAFAVTRRDIGDILPGVAIAISLVPPLCVVGVTGAQDSFDGALGALLLYTTNVLAILVAGIVVFGGTRLTRHEEGDLNRGSILAVVAAGVVVVVAALGVSTYRTVQLTNRLNEATDIADSWAAANSERVLDTHFEGTSLVVVVEGLSDGSQDSELPRLLSDTLPAGSDVIVERVAGQRDEAGEVG